MISKKLLTEIFKKEWALYQPNPDPAYYNRPFEITNIKEQSPWHKLDINSYILIEGIARDNRDWNQSINIYELAHRCKEWAFINYEFAIISYMSGEEQWECEIFKRYVGQSTALGEYTDGMTEPEAIFKACEWILK